MFYTPRKSDAEKSPRSTLISPNKTQAAGPSPQPKDDVSKVRRSIGEWEKGPGKTQTQNMSPVKTTSCIAAPLGSKLKIVTTQESKGVTRRPSVEAPGESQMQTQQKEQPKPADRVTLARNWLRRAKTQLNESRNLKSDLKAGITLAVEELYKLVKDEAEERKEKKGTIKKDRTYIKEKLEKGTMTMDIEKGKDTNIIGAETIRMLEWQKEKIEATYTEMVKIRKTVTAMQNNPPMQARSYAETVATSKAKTHREPFCTRL